MDVFDKIRWLTDKRHGFGIPMSTLSRYCGTHPNTIKYHLTSSTGPVKEDTVHKYEEGINEMIEDFKKNIIEQ